jgi:hypothetical protein
LAFVYTIKNKYTICYEATVNWIVKIHISSNIK